ncbi:lipopolysaccharide biosynthesis protein [Flagellimonas nanhaiensis]|uniref:Sugar transporter n=1 Tax=Flagellimonas nanhaiensis TaxID=2292706 RepID=A0A371JKV5_9FLAO|nr:hypothetical protein [Allomuricauda nanhaiensis]RDY57595.1 hypothetical protein DX873_18480 [Allomuricauda nanhaiensis]
MSRLVHTIKNAWIALTFHVLYVLTQFISRNIFLEYLGDDFVGTTGTIKSILQFLNLAELGIGAAVGFALYNPIFNNDRNKINEIIGYLGYLYKRIGLIVLLVAIILTFFFPVIFANSAVEDGLILYLFIALLASNLISYFFAYFLFLLEADQKNYVNNIIGQTSFILKLLVQCIVLYFWQNIVLWISLEIIFSVIYVVVLRNRIQKIYPWLNFKFKTTKEIRRNNGLLLQKIKQLSIHKIGNFVSNGTDNILIFSFINPESVAFVGNYQLVMNNLNTLLNKLFVGTNASVGNLVAENNLKTMDKVFWEMMALRFFFAGITSIGLWLGFDGFIILWLGENYLLSKPILLCFIGIFFILQVRQPVDCFKQAYGLYGDTWAPLVQSAVNLAISLLCIIQYGIIGVLFGTIISQLIIVMIWRPYYLFKYGFKWPVQKYVKGFAFHLLLLGFTGLICFIPLNLIDMEFESNFVTYFFKLLSSCLIFTTIYFLALRFLSKGFEDVVKRFMNFFMNKINPKNKIDQE